MKKLILLSLMITTLFCMAAWQQPQTAEVPIIMYHLVTKNGKYVGKHGITPTELENDLKYLKENGYNTIVMQDLINFVKKGRELPEKPIVLTFDDGNSSDYRYLYPLLQQYDMKAVVSVIGKAADECTVLASKQDGPKIFPNLTWEQIKEMEESKYIEIQNHSYDLHGKGGSGQRQGESAEEYHSRLREDLGKMQEVAKEMAKAAPTTFTYPLGIITDSSEDVLRELDIVASLSCHEGYNNIIENAPECLYRLKRDNRPSGVPVSKILQNMKRYK